MIKNKQNRLLLFCQVNANEIKSALFFVFGALLFVIQLLCIVAFTKSHIAENEVSTSLIWIGSFCLNVQLFCIEYFLLLALEDLLFYPIKRAFTLFIERIKATNRIAKLPLTNEECDELHLDTATDFAIYIAKQCEIDKFVNERIKLPQNIANELYELAFKRYGTEDEYENKSLILMLNNYLGVPYKEEKWIKYASGN